VSADAAAFRGLRLAGFRATGWRLQLRSCSKTESRRRPLGSWPRWGRTAALCGSPRLAMESLLTWRLQTFQNVPVIGEQYTVSNGSKKKVLSKTAQSITALFILHRGDITAPNCPIQLRPTKTNCGAQGMHRVAMPQAQLCHRCMPRSPLIRSCPRCRRTCCLLPCRFNSRGPETFV